MIHLQLASYMTNSQFRPLLKYIRLYGNIYPPYSPIAKHLTMNRLDIGWLSYLSLHAL